MALLFANNANSTLAAPVGSGDTSCTVAPGEGALFPSPTGGDYFVATFVDAATGLNNEIVYVTARTGDVMTITRAQEGTSAANWNSGDLFSNYWTAGQAEEMVQQSQLQAAAGGYFVATGVANTYAITMSPAPASLSDIVGVPLRVKINVTNTLDACTLNVNGLGAQNIEVMSTGGTTALGVGTLLINRIVTLIWDGTRFQFNERPQAAPLATIQAGLNNTLPITPLGLNIGFNASTPFSAGGGASDFQSFPNGLYMMWGNYTTVTGSTDLITLPFTFPNAIMSLAAVALNGPNVDVIALSPNAGSPTSQLIIAVQRWTGSAFTAQSGVLIRWIAIGY